MNNRKRLTRIVGVSVLTGATVLSQSGVAGATELSSEEVTETTGVPGNHLELLESKYGSQTVAKTDITNIGSIANIKGGTVGDLTNIGSISHITAEDCADGNVTSIGSIVKVDEACADKITSIGSIVKVSASTDKVQEETKTETKTETKHEETKTETPKAVNKDADCPADAILNYNYVVNGVSVGKDLSSIKAGDTVKVDFEIAPGCEDVELSLAIYDAPSDTFSADTASQQVLSDSQTGKFGPGKHSMEVVVPECFYQLDFASGKVITNLSATNLYGDRLISSVTGGEECVAPEVPEVPEVPETPAPVTEVQEVQLAHTGVESTQLAALGSALLLMGVAMERASKRMRVAGAHFA